MENGIIPHSSEPVIPTSPATRAQQVRVAGDERRKSQFMVTTRKLEDHPIQQYVMGDCPGISEWVDTRNANYRWFLLFVESLLRSFGALVFVNNVWSGILFFLAVLIHNAFSALVGLLGVITSYLVGMLLNVHHTRLRSGVATFNGFMVASFVAAVTLPPVAGVTWNAWVIFPAIFLSILSTLFKISLHSILQTVQLPALNLPFSLTTLCFLASQGSTPTPLFPAHMSPLVPSLANHSISQYYTTPGIIRGIFFSISNIYGCDNVVSVCLAWAAVFLASPLLCVMCLLGSCVGTGIAIVLGVSAQQLYTGIWSFNSLLVCGSIGGFFYVWTFDVFVVAVFSAGFAAVFSSSFYHVLGFVDLPFQALPLFFTDAIVLLSLGAYSPKWFTRVKFRDIRYPELHRQLYRYLRRLKATTVAPVQIIFPANHHGPHES